MAGAVLREVLLSLFVAGAVFGVDASVTFRGRCGTCEGLNVRLGAKCCILQLANVSW